MALKFKRCCHFIFLFILWVNSILVFGVKGHRGKILPTSLHYFSSVFIKFSSFLMCTGLSEEQLCSAWINIEKFVSLIRA